MNRTVFSLGAALRLTLELECPRFGLEPENLFQLAVRQNAQRSFLFVSKVLGKHLPIHPAVLLSAGKLLALSYEGCTDGDYWAGIIRGDSVPPFSQVLDQLTHARSTLGPDERTLFVGFAETATGLARAVAECFDGEAAYLSTTRLNLPGLSPLSFDESHSHARTHLLYLDPSDPFFATCQRVVLVDDEFTTGNTALRLIRQLHHRLGIKHFTLMTLLDNSDATNRQALEQELNIKIQIVSLLHGRIAGIEAGNLPPSGLDDRRGALGLEPKISFSKTDTPLSMGRSLLTSDMRDEALRLCEKISAHLGSAGKETLFLGNGELIYEPAIIAGLCGGSAFHSITQSPIYALAGSAIESGVHFDPADSYSAAGYVYNIPQGRYRRAILFTEASNWSHTGMRQLTAYLSGRGISDVEVVPL